MPKYTVLMKCIAFVDVNADSCDQALSIASRVPEDHLRNKSEFSPEVAFLSDDIEMINRRLAAERLYKKIRRVGRPTVKREDIPKSFVDGYALYKAGSINISQLARLARVSRPTVYKYIKLLEGNE